MRDILAAGKKPVSEVSVEPAAGGARVVAVQAPQRAQRAGTTIEADPENAAAQLAAFLKAN
jgi:electron transfer flavoprotein alpha/beta subunit